MKERINKDFMEAFKSGDKVRKNFLGLIKGEIQSEEKRGGNVNVDAILKKMEKSLKQTNTTESLAKLEILKEYLPDMLSEIEVSKNITSYIYEEGCDNLGKIMAAFNRDYKGRVDNKLVSQLAKIQLDEII